MAHGQFAIMNVNPNDNAGGGGCICDARKQVDCKPPYIVCYQNEMFDPTSPHVVVCATCLALMNKLSGIDAKEIQAGGEPGTVPTQLPNAPRRDLVQEREVKDVPIGSIDFADGK